jgi:hypothetical protein
VSKVIIALAGALIVLAPAAPAQASSPPPTFRNPTWSGYVDVAKDVRSPGTGSKYYATFASVQATFTVPAVSCAHSIVGATKAAYAAWWVGLDGYNKRLPKDRQTVEQVGVSAGCASTRSKPVYWAWYQWVPFMGHQQRVGPMRDMAGDRITVSVTTSDSMAEPIRLKLTDANRAHKSSDISVGGACTAAIECELATAEVISEAPNGGPTLGYNLADYGKVVFTDVHVSATSFGGPVVTGSLDPTSLWSLDQLDNYYRKDLLQQPGPLLAGGRGFDIVWHASR